MGDREHQANKPFLFNMKHGDMNKLKLKHHSEGQHSYVQVMVDDIDMKEYKSQYMIEGEWITVAIAADNVDKIEPAGEMRLYCHEITCEEECKILKITFYVHENGHCSLTTVTGYLQEDGETYRTQYQGDNHYVVVKQTPENIVFYSENVDRASQKTKLIFVLGHKTLTHEQNEKLVEFAESKHISPENIREVLDIDIKMRIVLHNLLTVESWFLRRQLAIKKEEADAVFSEDRKSEREKNIDSAVTSSFL
ncbi:odorant-binding protein 1a-like [Apodemus sylvaticus]|uniref:odorant-binding protein 1a-like n=1 Tax=Apodemus sylvaticus TaxID=10129 RepID=UPI002243E1AB|nr:odorant-binding protein 1a-like [Apodemus sylvaticus]